MLRGKGIEIELWSGLAHHKIAVPSMFLVDQAGTIRWAHGQQDHRERPSMERLFAAIDHVGLDVVP